MDEERTPMLAYITTPDEATAGRIGRTLVEERLAACANVVPRLVSYYRWEGEVQEDAEALLLAKTTEDLVDLLMQRVKALHPYAVPAIVAVPLARVHEPYRAWLCGELQAKR